MDSPGEYLDTTSKAIDQTYKSPFLNKTRRLLDERVTEAHNFLGATLRFKEGQAEWQQDLWIFNTNTQPVPPNTAVQVSTADHAYSLFKEYYQVMWFARKNALQDGITDLESYCK